MTTVSPFSTPVSFYMFPNPKLIHSFYNLYTMLVLTITSQCGHFLFSEDKMKPDIGYVDNLLKKNTLSRQNSYFPFKNKHGDLQHTSTCYTEC